MTKVNSKSPVSLPSQIKDDIRRKILSCQLKSEEKLPSEEKLAQEYGVSRMTARHALIELISEGVIYRIPGKGTFIGKESRVKKKSNGLGNNLIMLIVPNLRYSFYYEIIQGVERSITKSLYEVILRSVNEDALDERNCLQKVLEGEVSGLILVAGKYSQSNLELLHPEFQF